MTRRLDPDRVETATPYQLTHLGRSLDEPVAALNRQTVNWPHVETARRRWSPVSTSRKFRQDTI